MKRVHGPSSTPPITVMANGDAEHKRVENENESANVWDKKDMNIRPGYERMRLLHDVHGTCG